MENSMYALLAKKDEAHKDKIYAGAWAQLIVAKEKHNFMVTGGLDKLVKVWQFENNQLDLIHTLEGHDMGIMSVAVSPDGHTIASVSLDSTLIIWELLSGNKIHELDCHKSSYWASVFSPDGEHLAVAGYTGKIVIMKVAKAEVVKNIDITASVHSNLVCIAWSPDGNRLAVGTTTGIAQMYDLVQDTPRHTTWAHKEVVRCVAFSPSSRQLATASSDGMVNIYSVKTGLLEGTLNNNKCWVLSVCFSGDGLRLAAGDDSGAVTVARLRPMKPQKQEDSDDDSESESSEQTTMTSISNATVTTVKVKAPVSKSCETMSSEKSEPESLDLEVLHVFKEHTKSVWSVRFSPDQTSLLSVSKDQSINIYNIPALTKS